jgi:hypothetical protein
LPRTRTTLNRMRARTYRAWVRRSQRRKERRRRRRLAATRRQRQR